MLSIVTIALDAAPYIFWHLEIFEKLTIPWHWYIVEGASNNGADQSWCRPQEPRLSRDGTTEYLRSIADHPNVTVIQRPGWNSKTEMMNAATECIKESGVLLQVDSDEIHETANLERIVALFAIEPGLSMMRLPCVFMVGPNLRTVGVDCWGSRQFEWLRAFRFKPGMKWAKHEPPVLSGCEGRTMTREESESHGLSFLHMAYCLESQVKFKQDWYGYDGAVECWRKLQAHKHFPTELQRFFFWVDDRVMVDRISV